MKKIVIAIDGFSSCGKSTMAKDLAREIGYIYVDTGAMYRSVTLYSLRNNMFGDDGKVDEARLHDAIDKSREVMPLEQMELEHVQRAVEQCHGNMSKAAEMLGITRQTLYKKLGKNQKQQ